MKTPKKNKSKSVAPKSILDATGTANRFLSVFSFTRISNRDGRYVARDIKLRSAMMALLFLGFDLFCACKRIGTTSNASETLLEMLSTCALWSQYLQLVLSLNRAKETDVIRQFDMITSVDQALGINTVNTYRADTFRINLIFFTTMAMRLVTTGTQQIVWTIIFIYAGVTWPFVMKATLTVILSSAFVMYLVKIVLFKVRTSAMHKKITQLAETILVDSDEPATENKLEKELQKLSRAYLKMWELCQELNFTDGFQVILSYCNMLLNSITVIKTVTFLPKFSKGPDGRYAVALGASAALQPLFDIVFIVAVLTVLRSITIDADKTAARVEKYFASNKSLSKTSRKSWTELVELMRRNPLVFTAGDFFTLDYSLLVTSIATVVTYTVILTQIA